MDLATVLGLVLAFGAILGSVVIEGGHLRSLVNVPAAMIVFGGTFGAAMISSPLSLVIRLPVILKNAVLGHLMEPRAAIAQILELATLARREGVLALEAQLADIPDPFLRKGIELVVSGTDPEVVREIMETEMATQAERHKMGAKLFLTLGGLAPTLGVTGTVMGLVHMMEKLDDPSKMGPAIAAAFIATLYGVASANVVFIPIGNKLTARSQQETFVREMMLEGILGLQAGLSPMIIEEKLKAFLEPRLRQAKTAESASSSSDATEQAEAA
ncbi:MAG: flagellar motor protein [Armatimonadetes bacterium]|nr:flagellar motor protein [Armatimonadota bacterium]